jgi:hypothetical protein
MTSLPTLGTLNCIGAPILVPSRMFQVCASPISTPSSRIPIPHVRTRCSSRVNLAPRTWNPWTMGGPLGDLSAAVHTRTPPRPCREPSPGSRVRMNCPLGERSASGGRAS